MAKPSMRALASALIALTATCFGQGVGPLAVGVVNDALRGSYGTDAVRYSLLSAAITTTLGALLFVWAARSGTTRAGPPPEAGSPALPPGETCQAGDETILRNPRNDPETDRP
ncbi:hypothetical protein [Bradyrhizobium sp. AS23.2]|uniref:hypothetical protein n=1 Tax=Bradyrhizobium sp. AS23.2 TaxID=1680155 RepID=UPI00095BC60A|nr:hypothetical protein [Bradyrhizobium sp. AS23.2]OKO72937.1 hypothetical protein AC630_29785 [Bradyrhizobium sp. AS23.2]